MTLPEKDAERLIDLLSPAWDGTFTDADNERINEFLETHGDQGAEALLKVTAVHLELSKHVSSVKLFERVISSIEGIAQENQRQGNGVGLVDERSIVGERSIFSSANTRWATAAMAAVIAFVVGTYALDPVNWFSADTHEPVVVSRTARLLRPSRPVASLISVSSAVWGEGVKVQVGQTLYEQQHLELQSGTAQLSMTCGADIVLQAPCRVTLVDENFVRLRSGKVTAQAAEWATGFVIAAADLEVTDLGTRFAVTASEDGVVEAHVLEGSVLASPLQERRRQQSSMLLKSGQAIRVDGVRSKVDLFESQRHDFIDVLEQFRPLRPISVWNTGVGEKVGAADPHWDIVSGSEEFGPYPRQATIVDGDTGSYEDNRPDVSQWVSVSSKSYPGVPPESTHTFETAFDLTGYDLDTVRVVGHFLVDDAINSIRINGHPVEYERWETTWDVFDFKSFHPIEITGHFVPGRNVITIEVYNSPSRPDNPNANNPTALRVEWQAFGCLSVSEAR